MNINEQTVPSNLNYFIECPINPRPDSLVPSALSVNDYCQNAASAWKKLGAKTTQVNARMHGNCGP